MADELRANLALYKSQLQQVEASLTTSPDNEDLLKLKRDLQEVIDLTLELIGNKQAAAEPQEEVQSSERDDHDDTNVPHHHWQSGESCMAMWSEDGQYYEAKLDEILEDGTCTVQFQNYGNTDVTEVSLLRTIDPENKRTSNSDDGPDKKKSKKDLIAEQREYKRKKSQKKAQRLKQMEEERESDKNKWLEFNAKTFAKTSKGRVKRSIFATSEHVNGKVGVGTCGVGGRPMTSYTHQEKWKK